MRRASFFAWRFAISSVSSDFCASSRHGCGMSFGSGHSRHAAPRDLHETAHCGEWRAQLVRCHRQELRLELVELLQLDQALAQPAPLECAPDRGAQLVDVRWLDEVVVRAAAQRGHRRFERGVPGEHDRDRVGPELLRLAQDLDPVEVVEPQVGEHDVELCLAQLGEGLLAGRDRGDLVAVELQDGLDRRRDALLVVDDEDLTGRHRPAVPRSEA